MVSNFGFAVGCFRKRVKWGTDFAEDNEAMALQLLPHTALRLIVACTSFTNEHALKRCLV